MDRKNTWLPAIPCHPLSISSVRRVAVFDYFRFARHPLTIQKLIWPSRRANAFRNLPDGEAAKLEEARQQAEHEDGTEAWRTAARRFISRLELSITLTHHTTVTRSATLA
jgi:hypothetical protein